MNNQMSSAVSMLQAHHALEQGDLNTAHASLSEIITYSETANARFLSLLNPRVVNDVFNWGLSTNLNNKCINKLLKKYQSVANKSTTVESTSSTSINIHTFGDFVLEINGKPLSFSGKTQKKPIELLKAIIIHGKKPARKELLAELLWPDVDGDTALNCLRTTLQRLRKLVGKETVILRDERISLNEEYCQVDTWKIKGLINDTEKLLCTNNTHKNQPDKYAVIENLNKITDLYKGHFLENDPEQKWVLPMQERLRNRVIHTLVRCAKYLSQTNEHQLALECYKKGILIDDRIEIFYQGCMGCYLSLGNFSQGLLTYDSCKKIIRQSMGIELSKETRRIFNLLGGEPTIA